MEFQAATNLWFIYTARALLHSQNAPRLVTFYEDVIGPDREKEVSRVSAFLGSTSESQQRTDVVRSEFVHSHHSYDDVFSDGRVTKPIHAFLSMLLKWRCDGWATNADVIDDAALHVQPEPVPFLVRKKYQAKARIDDILRR